MILNCLYEKPSGQTMILGVRVGDHAWQKADVGCLVEKPAAIVCTELNFYYSAIHNEGFTPTVNFIEGLAGTYARSRSGKVQYRTKGGFDDYYKNLVLPEQIIPVLEWEAYEMRRAIRETSPTLDEVVFFPTLHRAAEIAKTGISIIPNLLQVRQQRKLVWFFQGIQCDVSNLGIEELRYKAEQLFTPILETFSTIATNPLQPDPAFTRPLQGFMTEGAMLTQAHQQKPRLDAYGKLCAAGFDAVIKLEGVLSPFAAFLGGYCEPYCNMRSEKVMTAARAAREAARQLRLDKRNERDRARRTRERALRLVVGDA